VIVEEPNADNTRLPSNVIYLIKTNNAIIVSDMSIKLSRIGGI